MHNSSREARDSISASTHELGRGHRRKRRSSASNALADELIGVALAQQAEKAVLAVTTRNTFGRWWRAATSKWGLVVDLTQVTFVDSVGETVLPLFGRLGAEFIAENSYSLGVCDRLTTFANGTQHYRFCVKCMALARGPWWC
jgi:hypothetical protein